MRLLPVALGIGAGYVLGDVLSATIILSRPGLFTGESPTLVRNSLLLVWGSRLAVGLTAYAIARRVA